jgi:dTMP kinase
MTAHPGFLLAVEGVDGSGKRTQVAALEAAFGLAGRKVTTYSFPDYENSALGPDVKSMLSGAFGNATSIHPKLSAALFALERSQKAKKIREDISMGCLVICDRYVYSNVAHQEFRLPSTDRPAFRAWVEHLEFDVLGMPRPDATVLLDIDDDQAQKRRLSRSEANQGARPLDHYEQDSAGLASARAIYQDLSQQLGWVTVSAFGGGPSLITERLLGALSMKLPV